MRRLCAKDGVRRFKLSMRILSGRLEEGPALLRGSHGGGGAGQRAPDGGGPELGEGGQGGVPADAVPGAGLGLVPAEHVLARFERFFGADSRPAQVTVAGEQGQGQGGHQCAVGLAKLGPPGIVQPK